MPLESTSRSGFVALVATMSALGNILGFLSIQLTRLAPQVALDFSSLPVVIVALYLGWRYGVATGFISGLAASIMFGFVSGSTGFLTLTIALGKALTGFSVGMIAQQLAKVERRRGPLLVASVLLGFIPEALLILVYFQNLIPIFFPGNTFLPTLAYPVFIKAWGEMTIISFLSVSLIGNLGFLSFMNRFGSPTIHPLVRAEPRKR